jgi:hypothetical protein
MLRGSQQLGNHTTCRFCIERGSMQCSSAPQGPPTFFAQAAFQAASRLAAKSASSGCVQPPGGRYRWPSSSIVTSHGRSLPVHICMYTFPHSTYLDQSTALTQCNSCMQTRTVADSQLAGCEPHCMQRGFVVAISTSSRVYPRPSRSSAGPVGCDCRLLFTGKGFNINLAAPSSRAFYLSRA